MHKLPGFQGSMRASRKPTPLPPPLILSLPDGVDSSHFREGELHQPLLSLVQEGDTSPVYGHNELVL